MVHPRLRVSVSYGSWEDLARDPGRERHVVQLYREPSFVHRAVTAWILPTLARGGGAVLICAPGNAEGVRGRLREEGLEPATLEREGRLLVLDADALMARFMVDGMPGPDAFGRLAGDALARVRASCTHSREVRAWGEMVNLLRSRGNPEGAMALESLWNRVIDEHDIHLLCSYQVDNLAPETHACMLREVCEGHTQLIPEDDYARFDLAVSRALVEVFGDESAAVRTLIAQRRSLSIGMPPAEALLVAVHDIHPQLGERLLRATRTHLDSLARA